MNEEEKYTRGFNAGYILAEHKPALTRKLTARATNGDPYVGGIVAGENEYHLERQKRLAKEKTKEKGRG